jgi:hypothetical protein
MYDDTPTERCGRVVNTPASYSGGLEYKILAQTPAILTGFLGFPQSLQANARIVP